MSSSSRYSSNQATNKRGPSSVFVCANIMLVMSLLFNIQMGGKMYLSLTSDLSAMWPSSSSSLLSEAAPPDMLNAPWSERGLVTSHNLTTLLVGGIRTSATLEQQQQQQQTTSLATVQSSINRTGVSKNQTVNILFGMAGANTGFVDEWEVSLKSILLNAPVDAPLHVHIIANQAARLAVDARIKQAYLDGSRWRNPITITVYNVEDKTSEWRQFIKSKIRGHRMDTRVTLGGYYRLLAYKVIPPEAGPVLYMDVDAVITTNLNDLWKLVDTSNKVIQVSLKWLCSGFMILHMDKFDQFWDGIDNLVNLTHAGDQSLVSEFAKVYPHKVGDLPSTWDASLGNGWKHKSHWLLKQRPNGTGFLHFNGYRPGDEAFYTSGLFQYCIKGCQKGKATKRDFSNSWGLADYYVRVTWPWVKYFGKSKIALRHGGYPLRFEVIGEAAPIEPIKPLAAEGKLAWSKRVDTMLDKFRYEQNLPVKLQR